MKIKVIENTQARNPAVYLNGKLLTSEQYELVEMEYSKPMLGHCGVYEPQEIVLKSTTLTTGDTLVLIYPSKRYEFLVNMNPRADIPFTLKAD